MQIVFQDNNFLFVDKPAGFLSVDSRLGENESRPCLGRELENKLNCRIYPIHRLDYEVSGLIIYAKNSCAHAKAQKLFESRDVIKKYEALSEIAPIPDTQEEEDKDKDEEYRWQSFLLRGKKRAYEKPFGKHAITMAKLLGEGTYKGNKVLKWQLTPLTGRSHQLRYELYKHSMPIIGDVLYGSKVPFGKNTIALRAVELKFSRGLLEGVPEIITVNSLFDVLD